MKKRKDWAHVPTALSYSSQFWRSYFSLWRCGPPSRSSPSTREPSSSASDESAETKLSALDSFLSFPVLTASSRYLQIFFKRWLTHNCYSGWYANDFIRHSSPRNLDKRLCDDPSRCCRLLQNWKRHRFCQERRECFFVDKIARAGDLFAKNPVITILRQLCEIFSELAAFPKFFLTVKLFLPRCSVFWTRQPILGE